MGPQSAQQSYYDDHARVCTGERVFIGHDPFDIERHVHILDNLRAWDFKTALWMADALHELGVYWLEEPCRL